MNTFVLATLPMNIDQLVNENTTIVFSKKGCKFCQKLKTELEDLSIEYKEIMLDPESNDYDILKNQLIDRTRHNTFPQLFIKTLFFGGYTEFIKAACSRSLFDFLDKNQVYYKIDF